jgi:hypothetical protein
MPSDGSRDSGDDCVRLQLRLRELADRRLQRSDSYQPAHASACSERNKHASTATSASQIRCRSRPHLLYLADSNAECVGDLRLLLCYSDRDTDVRASCPFHIGPATSETVGGQFFAGPTWHFIPGLYHGVAVFECDGLGDADSDAARYGGIRNFAVGPVEPKPNAAGSG